MRKRLVRALIATAVAIGVTMGIADAAGAIELDGSSTVVSTFGTWWD